MASTRANELRASDWQMIWPEGSRFQVHLSGMSYPIRTGLHGRHMVYPVLAALAVVHATNQSMNTAVTAMERLTPARGRMNVVALPNGARIIQDDYKSSLETIETALDFLCSIPAARRLVLLGSITEPPNPQRQVYRRFGTSVRPVRRHRLTAGIQGSMPILCQRCRRGRDAS